jgi:two-component system NtrC family sensor kinase
MITVGASWSAIARPLRYAAVLVVIVVLIGGWSYLYLGARAIDLRVANAVLEGLRELKEIDSRWNDRLIAIRLAPTAAGEKPGAIADPQRVARVHSLLAVNAHTLGNLITPQSLTALKGSFEEKARAVDRFVAAKAVFSQRLDALLQANAALPASVRRSLPGQFESNAEKLGAAVLAYVAQPSSAAGQAVASTAAALLAQDASLAATAQVQTLADAARAIVQAKNDEDAQFRAAFFSAAGPRLDSLTQEFERQFGNALDDAERYRLYLFVYSALILLLALWLGWRLKHTYSVIAAINHQLREANELLEQRVTERTQLLQKALKQLKENEALLIQSEKMSSLGQMVAGVAHEVNTPLAYVKSSLEAVNSRMPGLDAALVECEQLVKMLKSDTTSEAELSAQFAEVSAQLDEIRSRGTLVELGTLVSDGMHGIGQIGELVTNLKDFARLDRSKIAEFDLNEGLASALVIARNQLRSKTVKKEFADIPKVSCSPSQINQVFLNLLTNAAQATGEEGGVISVRTARHGDRHVIITVQDNGHGIPREVLPKIFDPFFTTKPAGQGTGLGLSICYKIIAAHGGRIEVASTPGVGTSFTVLLPVTPVSIAEAA